MTPPTSAAPVIERQGVTDSALPLLSVMELQQALRNARKQPSPETTDDLDSVDDPADDEASDGDDFDDEPSEAKLPRPTVKARRPRNDDKTASPRHGRGIQAARRLLRLDRKPNDERGNADWLADFDHPAATPKPLAVPASVTEPTSDVRVTDAPRGFAAVCWRWMARIAVAVLLVAGVNQVFIRPFRTATPAVALTGMDVAAAVQVAARFTADYLTYQSSAVDAPTTAGSSRPAGWAGAGRLTVDLVQPGSTVQVDSHHLLVSVAARIQIDQAASQSSSTPTPLPTSASVTPATATNPASPTAGQPLQRWVTLLVPVDADAAGLKVSPVGPVFTGDAPAGVTPIAQNQPDASATAATQPMAATFLAAYAQSDVAYLASPGVTLNGLNATVQFRSLTGWTLSTPTASPGREVSPMTGIGSGTVIWQLAGTDLQIAQRYSIALTSAQGRWYAAAVGPDLAHREG